MKMTKLIQEVELCTRNRRRPATAGVSIYALPAIAIGAIPTINNLGARP